jgi:2-oxoglutarate ferredoxin oxidoreductase subunit gamma
MAVRHEIRFCGYGGQGIILAGHIIGQAASVYDHQNAVLIQDYGPEARGGACRADVVISDERILYPYIDVPTVLVAMFQAAYDKYSPRNSSDTLVIVDRDLVVPGKLKGNELLTIPARHIAEQLGREMVANTVMLGFLTAATNIVSVDAVGKAIVASVPKNTQDLNLEAFEQGYAYARETRVMQ